jgi:hypothetical protein
VPPFLAGRVVAGAEGVAVTAPVVMMPPVGRHRVTGGDDHRRAQRAEDRVEPEQHLPADDCPGE